MKSQDTMIERVQHRFLRRVSYHLGQPMSLFCHNNQPLQAKLGILTLRNRRIINDTLFLRNLINGDICCPEILALIGFYSPGRSLRHFSVFHVSAHSTSLNPSIGYVWLVMSMPIALTFLICHTVLLKIG